jgi:hypothetical protein
VCALSFDFELLSGTVTELEVFEYYRPRLLRCIQWQIRGLWTICYICHHCPYFHWNSSLFFNLFQNISILNFERCGCFHTHLSLPSLSPDLREYSPPAPLLKILEQRRFMMFYQISRNSISLLALSASPPAPPHREYLSLSRWKEQHFWQSYSPTACSLWLSSPKGLPT